MCVLRLLCCSKRTGSRATGPTASPLILRTPRPGPPLGPTPSRPTDPPTASLLLVSPGHARPHGLKGLLGFFPPNRFRHADRSEEFDHIVCFRLPCAFRSSASVCPVRSVPLLYTSVCPVCSVPLLYSAGLSGDAERPGRARNERGGGFCSPFIQLWSDNRSVVLNAFVCASPAFIRRETALRRLAWACFALWDCIAE